MGRRWTKRKYTKEMLAPVVQESTSYAGVLKSLGLKLTGGNYRGIQTRIAEYQLPTDHFRGKGWSRGETEWTNTSVRRVTLRNSFDDSEVFTVNSPLVQTQSIKRRLRRLGWPYECAVCRITEWCGRELSLQLDHINGIHTDNRLENLRFLCPNCHSQTSTFTSRNKASCRLKNGLDR